MINYLALVKVFAIISIILTKSSIAAELPLVPVSSSQLLLVITPSWDDHEARIYRFERSQEGWKKLAGYYKAVVGSKGLAWGIGPEGVGSDPVKKEGDRKAPAGIFPLVKAMGYAASLPQNGEFPYEQIRADSHCVDDRDSRYYNRIVRESDLPTPAAGLWKSSEIMRRKDNLYKWLVVVDYNTKSPVPGGGSCIFIHVWRSAEKGTAGCTAMAEKDVTELINWLKSDAKPVLVQLTQKAYEQLWEAWKLPAPEALAK
ncbi:MAG: L,D-transpeptidase family protein [Nitrospirota bacterium]